MSFKIITAAAVFLSISQNMVGMEGQHPQEISCQQAINVIKKSLAANQSMLQQPREASAHCDHRDPKYRSHYLSNLFAHTDWCETTIHKILNHPTLAHDIGIISMLENAYLKAQGKITKLLHMQDNTVHEAQNNKENVIKKLRLWQTNNINFSSRSFEEKMTDPNFPRKRKALTQKQRDNTKRLRMFLENQPEDIETSNVIVVEDEDQAHDDAAETASSLQSPLLIAHNQSQSVQKLIADILQIYTETDRLTVAHKDKDYLTTLIDYSTLCIQTLETAFENEHETPLEVIVALENSYLITRIKLAKFLCTAKRYDAAKKVLKNTQQAISLCGDKNYSRVELVKQINDAHDQLPHINPFAKRGRPYKDDCFNQIRQFIFIQEHPERQDTLCNIDLCVPQENNPLRSSEASSIKKRMDLNSLLN